MSTISSELDSVHNYQHNASLNVSVEHEGQLFEGSEFQDLDSDGYLTPDDLDKDETDFVHPNTVAELVVAENPKITILGENHTNRVSNSSYVSTVANALSESGKDVIIAIEAGHLGTAEMQDIFQQRNDGLLSDDEFNDQAIAELTLYLVGRFENTISIQDVESIRERISGQSDPQSLLTDILIDDYQLPPDDVYKTEALASDRLLPILRHYQSGHKVVPIDIDFETPGSAEKLGVGAEINRDKFMAEKVMDIAERYPSASIVANVGAFHAKTGSGADDPALVETADVLKSDVERPLGSRLVEHFGDDQVLSIKLAIFQKDPAILDLYKGDRFDTYDAIIPAELDERILGP